MKNIFKIKEADILLFRRPNFPNIGWWISKFTFSPYSHIGLATIENGLPYCLEFREFIGSRRKNIIEYINEGAKIDVFRVPSRIHFEDTGHYKELNFSAKKALKITSMGKEMLGKGYGWKNILSIFETYIPFIRLLKYVDKDANGDNYVCSTFVSYLYRKYYIDLCSFLADDYTTPGDIARSPILFYQFTLGEQHPINESVINAKNITVN